MTDIEQVRLCAEAMNLSSLVAIPTSDSTVHNVRPPQYAYNPLADDAQCLALEEWLRARGSIVMNREEWEFRFKDTGEFFSKSAVLTLDLRRRAVVECVATIMMRLNEAAKHPVPPPYGSFGGAVA